MDHTTDDKREAILAATLALVAEQGFHGTPASQIARSAGVGVGTIYRYFQDKDALIRELFEVVRGRVRARIAAGQPEDLPPFPERFYLQFGRLLNDFIAYPVDFRFIEQYHYSPFSNCGQIHDAEADDPYLCTLRDALAQGLIKPAPEVVLKAIAFGPLVALAKEYSSRPFAVDEAIISKTVQACWDALRC
jgi:AcrR family transcriptional regulator